MQKLFADFDWSLVVVVLTILAMGLVAIFSIAPDVLGQQLISAGLGIVLFFAFSQIDYQVFSKSGLILFIACLLFLLMPFIFGTITRGSLRWVQLGSLTLQPSELTKPALILIFAGYFASLANLQWRHYLLGLAYLALPALLIFFQPDLGSSVVVMGAWLGIALAAGIPGRWFLLGGIGTGIFLPLLWRFMHPYQKNRLLSYLNPQHDPLGANYHLIQAKIAVGAGQFLGRGWGRGTQSHLRFLPERYTDFIFASFAEEFGFVGSAVLLLAFMVLFWRIIKVAQKAKDNFGFLICLGVLSLFFGHFAINIGINLGLLPVTGIPLPLVSYGGSSLLATMICLGVVENVARQPRFQKAIEIR